MQQVFEDPETYHRGMRIRLDHPLSGTVDLIGNPLKLSETPVDSSRAPPVLGADTEDVLREALGLDADRLAALAADGTIALGDAR